MKKNERDLLEPVDITAIGSDKDPCFGKGYDLRTKECQSCGDSELCVMKTSQKLGKTREELEAKNEFLDSASLDSDSIKKFMRKLKRNELSKKEILDKTQTKYELSRKEVRKLYKQLK